MLKRRRAPDLESQYTHIYTQSMAVATDIDNWICCAREEPFAVLRQTQAEHTALVGMDNAPELVGIEAVDLHAIR